MTMEKAVFIDTNLDTHVALLVSDQDTVSDLKRKILSEHSLCFPSFGEIKINALKVKRRGRFYHLTDHMVVKHVFDGVKNSWFLSVDASGVMNHDIANVSGSSNALLCNTNGPLVDGVDALPGGTSNKTSFDDDSKLQGFCADDSIREVLKDLEMQVKHVSGDRCKLSSSDSSEKIEENCDLVSKGNEMLCNSIKYNKESSSNVISDLQCHFPLKEDIQNGALSKVKNKKKRKFDSHVESSALNVNIGSFNDTNIGNKHITDEAELDDNGLKEMVVDVPVNTLVEESTDARTSTKRRKKINKKSEHSIFDSSNKEKKTENKSKQKPAYSNNDAAVAVPSCLENIREENTKAILEGRRDFGKVPDEATIDEKIIEDGDSAIVQEAVTVLDVLSHDTNEAEAAKTSKENESVDPKVMLPEKSMKEVVDVPANIPEGESPDARITTKRRRKMNKKSEDLIYDSSKKDMKTKKSKQKPSYSNNDGAVAVPSCLEDTTKESTKATLERRQTFGKGPDEDMIHENVLEDASLRENHSVTVQEMVTTVPEVLSLGTNETEAAKTEKINEWLRENDPKVMPEDKSMKEIVDPSILLEGNSVAELGNISGTGKRVKKTKNTKGKVQLSSEMEYSVASGKTSTELLKGVHENVEKSVLPMRIDKPEENSENQDVKGRKKISSRVESFSDVQMKEQDAGHSTEKTREAHVLSKKIMKRDLVETSSQNLNTKGKVQLSTEMEYSVASGKTSTELLKGVHENVEKSVQPMHVDKPVEILENQDVKGIRKIRKKISSGVESLLDVQVEKQDVDHLIEKTKEPHVLSKKTRKAYLVETKSENLINSILQSDKDTVNKSLSLPFEAVVDEDPTNGFVDETNKKIVDSTTSHGDEDIIMASDNFLPSQNLQKVHSAVAFDNKVIKSRITVRRVEAEKNSEESGVGNSITIQGSLRENVKSDKLKLCLQKGCSKISENKKAAQRSTSRPKSVKVSATPAPSRLNVNEIDKDAGALTSSSEISSHKNKSVVDQKRMTARNISAQRSIKIKVPDDKSVQKNMSKRGKSLLSISSNVFKNDNGHSFEEDGLVDSDVSTRTPSDNLSSSDDSEVEDVAGSQYARRNVNDNNDLESILKSSSRFRKAMITASQTPIEDMDGLPVDYVPDSQPNI